MSMNGRGDKTIPPRGGPDLNGEWIYETVFDTFKFYGLS